MSPSSASKPRNNPCVHTSISPTPLRGTFVRVSGGSSRSRSASPRRRGPKQPVQIRLNLTEGQMDRITDAFASKVHSTTTTHQALPHSPLKSSPDGTQNRDTNPVYNLDTIVYENDADTPGMHSATFSELMPKFDQSLPGEYRAASLAQRRHQYPPSPLKMHASTSSHRSRSVPRRPAFESISARVSPLSPHKRMRSEPVASPAHQEHGFAYAEHPQFVSHQVGSAFSKLLNRHSSGQEEPAIDQAGLDASHHVQYGYVTPMVEKTPTSPPPRHEARPRPRQSPSRPEHLPVHEMTQLSIDASPERSRHMHKKSALRSPISFNPHEGAMPPSTPFSPFPFYFQTENGPITKRGEKKLIGENGWLERTNEAETKDKKSVQKRGGFLDSIKKMAKDMTELSTRPSHGPKDETSTRSSALITISTSSREQSLLYCELEFHLTTILNNYITRQLHQGLLSPAHLARISAQWSSLGRPRVVAFRYDLETQLDLVILHLREFHFSGRRHANVAEVSGVLQAMKTNARQMRVRTFCAPDSVVAKHLVDAQRLCEVVGAEQLEHKAIAEVVQFFRVCVEREAAAGSRD